MAMPPMPDPSYGISRDLLPHIHLISTYRYADKPRIEINEVTNWLLQAPSIARDKAPFFWTYLDRPPLGNVTLIWQAPSMGTNFASDGYIWPPAEMYFTSNVGNGVVLEMFYHKAGYAMNDMYTSVSRRRFRLRLMEAPAGNTPQIDPNLWIVQYGPVENNERHPLPSVPRDPRTPHILETRAHLHRCGQIQRKEFILGDRVNWPQISWPREPARQAMYPSSRGVPSTMAYPPHPPTPGIPPSKRVRVLQPVHMAQAGIGMGTAEGVYDDEEDVSRGDMFDHLTPRDISLYRYRQNHEWMEEILASPYSMNQITVPSLGLGLQGRLSSLTDGLLEAQGIDALTYGPRKSGAAHLDAQQAAEFSKRISNHVESEKTEIVELQEEHKRRMMQLKKNSLLSQAEKELRTAVDDSGPSLLRLEGYSEEEEEGSRQHSIRHNKKVSEIVLEAEAHVGHSAEVVHSSKRVQDGGYQQPVSDPSPDTEMPDHIEVPSSASGAHSTAPTSSSLMVGARLAMTQGAMSAACASGSGDGIGNGNGDGGGGGGGGYAANASSNGDTVMGGTEVAASAPDQGTGSGDWVVVPRDGTAATPDPAGVGQAPVSKQASAQGTPAAELEGADFHSFTGELDSFDMAMEDSAFGDAFHGVEAAASAE